RQGEIAALVVAAVDALAAAGHRQASAPIVAPALRPGAKGVQVLGLEVAHCLRHFVAVKMALGERPHANQMAGLVVAQAGGNDENERQLHQDEEQEPGAGHNWFSARKRSISACTSSGRSTWRRCECPG